MRWQFLDDFDADYKRSILENIDRFWSVFEQRNVSLTNQFGRTLSEAECSELQDSARSEVIWVGNWLGKLDERLMWECERLADGRFLFVVTPEQSYELRSLANTVIDRAPHLDDWSFSAYRQPVSIDLLESAFDARQEGIIPRDLTFGLAR